MRRVKGHARALLMAALFGLLAYGAVRLMILIARALGFTAI
ncbi:MAG: hypothetical protein ACTSRY_04345 [Alphaproteobacteria bacterium]